MKDILTYKDYIATVHFSQDDDVFFGKIEGIDDLISFEGKTVDELKGTFIEAADEYSDLCKKTGKNEFKSYSGSFNVRVNPKLHRAAVRKAAREGVSLNQLVQKALEREILGSPK